MGKIIPLAYELLLELGERAGSCVLCAGTNYTEKMQNTAGWRFGGGWERRLNLRRRKRKRDRKTGRKKACRVANTELGRDSRELIRTRLRPVTAQQSPRARAHKCWERQEQGVGSSTL